MHAKMVNDKIIIKKDGCAAQGVRWPCCTCSVNSMRSDVPSFHRPLGNKRTTLNMLSNRSTVPPPPLQLAGPWALPGPKTADRRGGVYCGGGPNPPLQLAALSDLV